MERSRNGTMMSLNSQDFENLESVEELYFGERETEDNQDDSWNNCQGLSSAELDLVILGVIQSSLNCGDVNLSGRTEKQRKRTRMVFFYHGRRICKEIVFIF